MLLPMFIKFAHKQRVYGNRFPSGSKLARANRILRLSILSSGELVDIALASKLDAKLIFSYPEIAQKLSLKDMLKIFFDDPELFLALRMTPELNNFSRNLSFDQFDKYFERGVPLGIQLSGIKNINLNDESESSMAATNVIVQFKKTSRLFSGIDFSKLDPIEVQKCREYIKYLYKIDVGLLKKYLDAFLKALDNPRFIDELEKLNNEDFGVFCFSFQNIAETALKNPALLEKLTSNNLCDLCYIHPKVAEKVICTRSLLMKTLQDAESVHHAHHRHHGHDHTFHRSYQVHKMQQQQAKLASWHPELAEKVFEEYFGLFSQGADYFVKERISMLSELGKNSPKIAQKILQDPDLDCHLNENNRLILEHVVSLYQKMREIFLLPPKPDSDQSSNSRKRRNVI